MSAGGGGEEGAAPLEFRGVQALRGVAALMVVVFHATQLFAGHVGSDVSALVWGNGARGVDVFFVISGFVMVVSSKSKTRKAHPARHFIERRLIRVAPLYWLMTAIFLFRILAEHVRPQLENGAHHPAITFPYVACSLLFIPFRNSLGVIQPPLIVGWTLSFEMFFYVLFAGALALRIRAALLLTPLLVLLAAVGMFRPEGWPAVTILANPLLLEFVAGVLIGSALEKGARLKTETAAALAILGLLAIMALPALPAARWIWIIPAVAATSLVLGSVMLEKKIRSALPRWVLRIGDASYSLYLSHLLLFAALVRPVIRVQLWCRGVSWGWEEALIVAVLTILATLASFVVFHLVESPLNTRLREALRRREARLQQKGISGLSAA